MGCNRQGLVGIVYDISTPTLVRGADCFVTTQIQFAADNPSDTNGPPYSFQSFAGSTAYFPSDPAISGAPIAVTGALVSADLGVVKFPIPQTASSGLQVGDSIAFEQVFQDARGTTIILFQDLPVAASLF